MKQKRKVKRPYRLGLTDALLGCCLNPYRERHQRRLYDMGLLRGLRYAMHTSQPN